MKEFSVIILCYNSETKALYRTLDSVLKQKNIDMEIVLADDASSNDCLQKAVDYLNEKNYTAYKVQRHEENVGTVQNIADALSLAEGTYIKCIGAGDMLFEDVTLQKVRDFMNENGCAMCFGKMQAYCASEKKHVRILLPVPADIRAHQKNQKKRICKNIIQNHGWIAGASMFYRNDTFSEYLPKLLGVVRYCEDLLQVILLLDNQTISYMDCGVVYYEYGSGISTNAGKGNSDRMRMDHQRFWNMLKKQYPGNSLIQKGSKMHYLEYIAPLGKRYLQIILHNPGYVCMVLRTKLQRRLYRV